MEIVFAHDEARSRFGDPGPGTWTMLAIVIILGLITLAAGIYDWHLITSNADPNTYSMKT